MFEQGKKILHKMADAELPNSRRRSISSSSAKEARLKREAQFENQLRKINSPLVSEYVNTNSSSRRKSKEYGKRTAQPPLADAMEAYMVRRLRQLSTGLTGGSHEGSQIEQQLSGLSPRVLSLAQQLFDVAEQELGITEHIVSPSPSDSQPLHEALCDLSERLHEQDHGVAAQEAVEPEAMQMLQGALVALAEENVLLQQRVYQLEHIALAAALAPVNTIAASTPPESPPVHSTPAPASAVKRPQQQDDRTPPSPLAASRLEWAESTPDGRGDELDDDTPPKPTRLSLGGDLDARLNKYMKEPRFENPQKPTHSLPLAFEMPAVPLEATKKTSQFPRPPATHYAQDQH